MSSTRMKTFSIKVLAVAACALTAISGISLPTPAQAQVRLGRAYYGGWGGRPAFAPRMAYRPAFGGWRGAYGYRPAFGGWRGGYGYRPYYGGWRGAYGYRPWRGGWGYPYARRAYWGGGYGFGYPYWGGGYYDGGFYGGGALAAGLIGGLALGAIASGAARPAYRPATYGSYDNCFYERRRVVNRYGNAVVRRVRSCY